jgi:hypothetical protein
MYGCCRAVPQGLSPQLREEVAAFLMADIVQLHPYCCPTSAPGLGSPRQSHPVHPPASAGVGRCSVAAVERCRPRPDRRAAAALAAPACPPRHWPGAGVPIPALARLRRIFADLAPFAIARLQSILHPVQLPQGTLICKCAKGPKDSKDP